MIPAPAPTVLRKILVIDDDPIIQRTVYFALRDKGFLVLMSGTISDALVLIHQQKPELVLLDLNFPADSSDLGVSLSDGLAALKWLQRTEYARNIPIIIISGANAEASRPQALAAGAVAYFPKPIDKEQLQTTILAILGRTALNPSTRPVARPGGDGLAMA
jgi:CheY-like chemotaxis protein